MQEIREFLAEYQFPVFEIRSERDSTGYLRHIRQSPEPESLMLVLVA